MERNYWDVDKTYTIEFDRRFSDDLWKVEYAPGQITNENGYRIFGGNIRKTI